MFFLAVSNSYFKIFSLSPMYLEIISDELMEKNFKLHIVAHALAKNVFPVPDGPYKRIPLHGFLIPSKIDGNLMGKIKVSFKIYLAFYKPAISSHLTLGFSRSIISENFY